MMERENAKATLELLFRSVALDAGQAPDEAVKSGEQFVQAFEAFVDGGAAKFRCSFCQTWVRDIQGHTCPPLEVRKAEVAAEMARCYPNLVEARVPDAPAEVQTSAPEPAKEQTDSPFVDYEAAAGTSLDEALARPLTKCGSPCCPGYRMPHKREACDRKYQDANLKANAERDPEAELRRVVPELGEAIDAMAPAGWLLQRHKLTLPGLRLDTPIQDEDEIELVFRRRHPLQTSAPEKGKRTFVVSFTTGGKGPVIKRIPLRDDWDLYRCWIEGPAVPERQPAPELRDVADLSPRPGDVSGALDIEPTDNEVEEAMGVGPSAIREERTHEADQHWAKALDDLVGHIISERTYGRAGIAAVRAAYAAGKAHETDVLIGPAGMRAAAIAKERDDLRVVLKAADEAKDEALGLAEHRLKLLRQAEESDRISFRAGRPWMHFANYLKTGIRQIEAATLSDMSVSHLRSSVEELIRRCDAFDEEPTPAVKVGEDEKTIEALGESLKQRSVYIGQLERAIDMIEKRAIGFCDHIELRSAITAAARTLRVVIEDREGGDGG